MSVDDRNNAILNGSIDYLIGYDISMLPQFNASSDVAVVDVGTGGAFFYLAMNNKQINKTFRQAISYAINYSYIIDVLLSGEAVRARSPVSPGILYSNYSNNCADFNLSKARQILIDDPGVDTAGLTANNDPDDIAWKAANLATFNYSYNTDSEFRSDLYPFLNESLKRIGINVTDGGMTSTLFYNRAYYNLSGGLDALQLFFSGWGPDFNDPSNMINPLFSNISNSNSAQVNDPYLQNLMEQGLDESDPNARKTIYNEIQRYLVEDLMPVVFCYNPKNYDVYHSYVLGYQSNSWDKVWFHGVYQNNTIAPKTIHINGNEEWIYFRNAWKCTGSGNYSDPYVIKDFIIDCKNSSSGIWIENSNVYFRIENCFVHNSGSNAWDAGIKLQSVGNATLFNNNVSNNNRWGIFSSDCENNTFIDNTLNENYIGIALSDSNNNTISGNMVERNNDYGIKLENSNFNKILDNNADNNLGHGMHLEKSDNCTVLGNTANNNTYNGITLLDSSDNNTILGNILNNNDMDPIYEWIGCENNDFMWNILDYLADPFIIDDNGNGNFTWVQASNQLAWVYGSGTYSDPYVIEDLIIDGLNSGSCILIENSIVYFKIENCSISNSGSAFYDAGIQLQSVSNGTLINNNASNNNNFGIMLYKSDNNTISGNTVYNNEYGISLNTSDNNNVSGNIANNNNQYGIYLNPSENNTIIGNTINNNDQYGIYLKQSNNTIVSGNFLEGNLLGAYYEEDCINNNFNWNVINDTTDMIVIDDNGGGNFTWSQAVEQLAWVYGSGTSSNPYIIKDLKIDGQNSSSCILIENSNVYFKIENCIVYNSSQGNIILPNYDAGIKLDNVTKGVLINNNCSNNNGMGIFVNNTTNIIMSGNFINNTKGHGILITYTNNSIVSGNNVSDNVAGILLAYSNNNTISENTVHNEGWGGIYLMYESNNNTVIGNNLTYNSGGIKLENSNHCTISGNLVNNSSYDGINLMNCNFTTVLGNTVNNNTENGIGLGNSNNNTISGNTANNNNFKGIYLSNSNNNTISGNNATNNNNGIVLVGSSNNNTISGNAVNNSTVNGIYLDASNNNTLSGNNVTNNIRGLYLVASSNNTALGNNAINNTRGIFLESSHNNIVSGNKATNNTYEGIYLEYSNNNMVSGNNAYNNSGNGIKLESSSNNTLSGNTVNNNGGFGINLWISNNNTVLGNNLFYNTFGIMVYHSNNSDIMGNNVNDNSEIGIAFSTYANYNTIYNNFLRRNTIHAQDNGTSNQWYKGIIGNYWDNYGGADINDDGIGDISYLIPGTTGSRDNYPQWWDGDNIPIITIITPSEDYLFGKNAPNYQISYIAVDKDQIWYTLNNSITSLTLKNITNLANALDQSLWDSFGSCTITIRFSINDTSGNIGYDEITVTKDVTAPLIIINYPSTNIIYGVNFPTFNISVYDVSGVDIVWYTIDGIFTSFTFNANSSTEQFIVSGTIDQSIWNSFGDETVIIRFYANDTLGNLRVVNTTISKRTTTEYTILSPIIIDDTGGW